MVMEKELEEIIKFLTNNHKTIATMESCTGGALANAITNIAGSSEVFKFGAVTYSNDFKIKMGVNPMIIEKYSVYSMQTAIEMALKISAFTNSDYAVGITGKLSRADKNNLYGNDDTVFISIYDKKQDEFINDEIKVKGLNRNINKQLGINKIINKLNEIIK
jgi:PncC family amidohydrolase